MTVNDRLEHVIRFVAQQRQWPAGEVETFLAVAREKVGALSDLTKERILDEVAIAFEAHESKMHWMKNASST